MLDLTALEKASTSLTATLREVNNKEFMTQLNKVQQDAMLAGAIQNFEFTYELCWKFSRRWLTENLGATDVEGVTRRELFRLAHQHRLINNVDRWMVFHQARKQAAHVYDSRIAQEVYQIACDFDPQAQALLQTLHEKND